MGKREATVEATRRRIYDAAQMEFTENGIANTSLQAVARRADLAAGTVLYHFSDIDTLAAAVVDRLYHQTRVPVPDVLPSRAPVEVRVTALVKVMYDYYEATSHLYPFYLRNQHHRAVETGQVEFTEALRRMVARALGRRAGVANTAVVTALAGVSFYAALTGAGLTTPQAARAAGSLARAAVQPLVR